MKETRFPETLPQFQKTFPDEAACINYLEKLRWPMGFVCSKCGSVEKPYRFKNRPTVLRCRDCKADTHITAGTIMHKTRTPLQTWFWGAYLVTSYTPGLSATQFQRQLGIKRYETAFQILHKLRTAMVRPDRDKIGSNGHVEVDEAFVGGRTYSKKQGVTNKVLVAAAVEVRNANKTSGNSKPKLYAGRLRLARISDRGQIALETFVSESVAKGSTIFTDGNPSYEHLDTLGYDHHATIIDGDHEKTALVLPIVHVVFSNLKTWLRGTHHGVSPKHLSSYLNEFTFRFNRRFFPMAAVNSVLGIAMQVAGRTYRNLYSDHQIDVLHYKS